jgi:hypothetical protein
LIRVRQVISGAGRVVAFAVLALGVLAIAAREVVPQVPQLGLARAFERDRFEESAAIAHQKPGSFLVEVDMVRRVRELTSPDAFFLIFHQNTFAYYANRRFIRDVDVRLVEFYRAPDKESALSVLRRFGFDYVYLPPWRWPTIDNSYIKPIVEDPAHARLVLDVAGYKLYQLLPR